MNKKNGLIFLAAAAGLMFFLVIIVKKISFQFSDLLSALQAAMLLAGAIYTRTILKSSEPAGHASERRLYFMRLLYRLCIFAAGVVLLKSAFELYREGAVYRGTEPAGLNILNKALAFFMSGLAIVFAFFHVSDADGPDIKMAEPVFKPAKVMEISLKTMCAVALAALGLYFIKTSQPVLAGISYAVMTVQLFFVFKFSGLKPEAVEKTSDAPGPHLTGRIMSLLMVAAALYYYYKSLGALQGYDIKFAMLYFIMGGLLFGYAPSGRPYRLLPPAEEEGRIFDLVYCIFIFVLAMVVFSWKITDVPPSVHGDETLSVFMSQKLAAGEKLPVVLDSEAYNGLSLLYYVFVVLAGKIWGISLITGKMLSVFTGSVEVVSVYLLVKNIFNRRAAVLASLLLTVFFMQIFYSRMMHQWVFVPAFAAIAFYLFFRALKRGNPAYFIAAGVMLSMDLDLYSAGKVSPFIIICFLGFMLLRKDSRAKVFANWKGLLLMFLAMALTFLPIMDYMIHFPAKYFTRMSGVSFLHGFPSNLDDWHGLADNILKNIQMFMTRSANGYCHNLPQKPFFDGFTAFAALAGLGYLLFTWKRESSVFIILWLFFGLLPGFLSHLGPEDPYPARTVLAIPALMIVLALGIDRVLAKLESLWPRLLKIAAVLCAGYFIAWFSFYNLRNYFILLPNDPHTQVYYRTTDKLNADYIGKNKDGKIITTPVMAWNYYYGMNEALSPPSYGNSVSVEDLSLFELYKLFDGGGRSVSLVGEGIYRRMFPIYREYFPNAAIQVIWDTNFWQFDTKSNLKYCYEWKNPDKVIELNQIYHWFYMYDNDVKFVKINRVKIPVKDIDAVFTLKAQYYLAGRLVAEKSVKFPVEKSDFRFDRLVLTGLIDVPDYTVYEFHLEGARGWIYINNVPVNGPCELYKGLHRIKLDCAGSDISEVSLKWKTSQTAGFAEPERKYFINSDKIFGLNAVYSVKGKTIYRQLEPDIDYRLYYYNLRPAQKFTKDFSYDIAWDGRIKIEQNDTYSFSFHTLYDARIVIDGKTVFKRKKGVDTVYPVKLEKGWKRVSITGPYRYVSNYWDPGSTLRFMYKKSEWKEFGPVTYDMLNPGF